MKLLQTFAFASLVMLPLSLVYADNTHQAVKQPAATEAHQDAPVNINKADADTLAALPGIGDKKAKAIVAYRDAHGAFQQSKDLADVKGISPNMIDKLGNRITVG